MQLNKLLSIALVSSILFTACGNNGGTSASDKRTDSNVHRMQAFVGGGGTGNSEVFIPADSANKMIRSYLQSIDSGAETDSSLHSLIFDADSMRAYLSNPAIKHVKVMFAHTLSYINTMGPGHNVGYERGALTAILGGYDEQGNYVFWKVNSVPDRMDLCPTNCPVSGTASSDLFPIIH